jgi:hypothetical protein
MLLDERCLRVLGERCPSTSYEPLLDRHPRQPDSHTVLTRLVITDGCGGSVIFEPTVEHRPRARERVVCESAAAGSFASSSLRRANWAPEEIQRYAWSNQFCTTLASVSSGLKGLFPVSIFIYHAIAVSAYDKRLPVSHPPINGCGGQRVVDVDDLARALDAQLVVNTIEPDSYRAETTCNMRLPTKWEAIRPNYFRKCSVRCCGNVVRELAEIVSNPSSRTI